MRVSIRNKRIFARHEAGAGVLELARRYSVTEANLRQILGDQKFLRKQADLGSLRGLGLDLRSYRIIANLTGIKPPMLIDLQEFIRKNADWELRIRREPGGGPATARNVKRFAREQGLIR